MGACASPVQAPSALPTETGTATLTEIPASTATATVAPTPTYTPRIPNWPLLQLGDAGLAEVYALQRLLRHHGFFVIADGRFDEQTKSVLEEAQPYFGVRADGIAGPETWVALTQGVLVQEGARGESVYAAQYLLNKYGNPVSVDGGFGPQDAAALKAFENGIGLAQDGIIDEITWQALAGVRLSIESWESNTR
jgi:peptidoglycan hydrolase-like protein with peptidoglycan-binding domain